MKINILKQSTISSLLAIAIILFCRHNIHAAETALSDPDHISTGIEYRGVSDVRLGDTFGYGRFLFGGMADIRNESRFNQEAIPNHNWRGFLFLYFNQPVSFFEDSYSITCGFEHESAHPTIGLNEGNSNSYDQIYDGTFRNINMNSFLLRLSRRTGITYELTFTGDMQFYYYSRNTPELPVNELTWSEGISGSVELKYPLNGNISLFISGFDRYIFSGRKRVRANIYCDTDTGVETEYRKYPVINSINTVSARTGLIFSELIPIRKVSVYCGILYGNIYGFVDSRENRMIFSAGVEIFH